MKRATYILGTFALALGLQSPALAKTRSYPMRVQVVRSHWHRWRGWVNGFGRANLMSQDPNHPPEQGMDFSYGCSEPVRFSFGPDTYPARFGKNPLEVIVALPQPGSDKMHECTLKVTMQNYVYVRTGHGLAAAPLGGGAQMPVPEGPQ